MIWDYFCIVNEFIIEFLLFIYCSINIIFILYKLIFNLIYIIVRLVIN